MMPNNQYDTLIIGAGAAGLSAAVELSRVNKDFALVEKSNSVGGLAKTYVRSESGLVFRTDNGPHLYLHKEKYLLQFIDNTEVVPVKPRQRVFVDGKSYNFPVQLLQLLRKQGYLDITKVLFYYGISLIKYRLLRRPVTNFYDYAVANLGKKFATLTTISFMEKVYGLPSKELHLELARQRFQFLSASRFLKSILTSKLPKKAKRKKKVKYPLLFPQYGTGTFYEAMKTKIENAGHPIFLNSYPIRIRHEGNKVKSVKLRVNQEDFEVTVNYLIESIHIPDLIELLDPPAPAYVREAAIKLRYRGHINLFITLDADKIIEEHSIYFTDAQVPFSRITEMKNFSAKMSPPGKTSLLVEFFCNEGDKIHRLTEYELLELALPFLEKYIFLKRSQIRSCYRLAVNKSYPVYDLSYETNIAIVKRYLDSFDNMFSIGRPGRFEYTSQPRSLEMGIEAARAIIGNEKQTPASIDMF